MNSVLLATSLRAQRLQRRLDEATLELSALYYAVFDAKADIDKCTWCNLPFADEKLFDCVCGKMRCLNCILDAGQTEHWQCTCGEVNPICIVDT
jgi:hypothetical protein